MFLTEARTQIAKMDDFSALPTIQGLAILSVAYEVPHTVTPELLPYLTLLQDGCGRKGSFGFDVSWDDQTCRSGV